MAERKQLDEAALAHFYGSEYRHKTILPGIYCSDGVKYVADTSER